MNGWRLYFPILAVGVAIGSASASIVRNEINQSEINECERANNVYQCKLVPMPVDPFHPENPK